MLRCGSQTSTSGTSRAIQAMILVAKCCQDHQNGRPISGSNAIAFLVGHEHGSIVSWCSVGFEDRPILTTANVPRGSVSLVMLLRSSLCLHPFRKYLEIILQRQGWRRRAGGQKNSNISGTAAIEAILTTHSY